MPQQFPLNTIGTPESATPAATAILASVPAIATVVRDSVHRVITCNPAYAENTDLSCEELVGTTHNDLQPGDAADERKELMRRVIDEGRAQDFLQFWAGRAWLCRVIPLDADAYGTTGTLSVIMQAPIGTPLADSRSIHVLDTADFGALTPLTPAEKRTAFDLAMGRSNNEIAERQDRSVRTIECHVRAIHEKLGTSSRSAIIRDASERGIQLFSEEKWDKMVGATKTRRPGRKKTTATEIPADAPSGVIEPKADERDSIEA